MRRQATPRPAWYLVDDKVGRRRCCRRPPLGFCCAWVCLALLLSFLTYIAHPALPRSTRFIGFQAFETIISPEKALSQQPIADVSKPDSHAGEGPATTADAGSASQSSGPSYPLDVYAPELPNPAPLTEIEVQACFPMWLKKCKPLTTAEKDARLGPWVLVERPLDPDTAASNSKSSSTFGLPSIDFMGQIAALFETKYLFYRRSRRSDVPKIVDVRIVQLGKDLRPVGGDFSGWHRVKTDLRSIAISLAPSKLPVHLYYRTVGGLPEDMDGVEGMVTTPPSTSLLDDHPITELDVAYGSGPAWPGFEPIGLVAESNAELKLPQVTLTARRDPVAAAVAPTEPSFREDGTFKILQLADLHLSVRHEKCRDVAWESASRACVADNDTTLMLERWLDEEKPDFVAFSGDQLNGQGTSWDEKSVIPKWVKPVIDRKIPWASIQGNHDDQSGVLSRPEQQALLSRLPYSLTRVGPPRLHDGVGAGNFYIKLKSPHPDGIHLFTLYFLDTGAYAPPDPWKPFKFPGYDWVRQDQVDWLIDISKKVKGITRPYQPDGGKDLAPIWTRGVRRPLGSKVARQADSSSGAMLQPLPAADDKKVWSSGNKQYLAKPKALLWMHIPVPEAFAAPDLDEQGKPAKFGPYQEVNTIQGAQKKAGLFDAIKSRPAEEQDVVALLHGHMHNNAGCERVSGIWICFNGGSSFAAYGKAGFERRARVLEISQWGDKVETWQRFETTQGRQEQHVLYQAKGAA